jgi:hypothetical protein
MQLDEKRGMLLSDSQKTADSFSNFAGSRVLRHLVGPLKLPWERRERNPVLNPKRAFCHFEADLGQSVVGMRDFALNVIVMSPLWMQPLSQFCIER